MQLVDPHEAGEAEHEHQRRVNRNNRGEHRQKDAPSAGQEQCRDVGMIDAPGPGPFNHDYHVRPTVTCSTVRVLVDAAPGACHRRQTASARVSSRGLTPDAGYPGRSCGRQPAGECLHGTRRPRQLAMAPTMIPISRPPRRCEKALSKEFAMAKARRSRQLLRRKSGSATS